MLRLRQLLLQLHHLRTHVHSNSAKQERQECAVLELLLTW